MTAELSITDEAIEAAALAQRSPSHRPGPPDRDLVELWKRTARVTLEAAAPLIVAAELERLAKVYWSSSHVHRVCLERAAELRGDRKAAHQPDASPIQPGKWYREHTAQQLVDEHTRRGIPVPADAGDDVERLAESLNADDVRKAAHQ